MQSHPQPARAPLGALVAAAVLVVFGIVAAVQGIDGRSTVRDALAQEAVVGTPTMTPSAIAAEAKKRGVSGLDLPTCSVAGKSIDNGADARCFAEYMRVDALMATGGKTYAQMPRFATKDGKGTNIEAEAIKLPNGVGMPNPARNVWVTETALSTALNTSYMAEQISLFGIAVGAAFLLVGLLVAAVGASGAALRAQPRRASRASPRRRHDAAARPRARCAGASRAREARQSASAPRDDVQPHVVEHGRSPRRARRRRGSARARRLPGARGAARGRPSQVRARLVGLTGQG